MSAEASTSAAAERDRVLAVYDGSMEEGAVWQVLSADWLQQWAAFVGLNLITKRATPPSTTHPPPPIDQSKLKDSAFPHLDLLRPQLLEGVDYELVPAAVADILFALYAEPTTPTFPRSVISVGVRQDRRVDVYPAVLTLVPLSEEGEEKEEEKRVEQFHTNASWKDVRDACISRKQQQQHPGKEGMKEEVKEEEKEEEVRHTHSCTRTALSHPHAGSARRRRR